MIFTKIWLPHRRAHPGDSGIGCNLMGKYFRAGFLVFDLASRSSLLVDHDLFRHSLARL
jgi:hypothetical protein